MTWARWGPPALLVVIAVLQIALVRSADLTAWKGGGLGMLSTLDHGASRGVEVVVEGSDRSEALDIPPSLEIAAARAVAFPSGRFLRALAKGVADREARYQRPVARVTLRVWRTSFDRQTLHAFEQPLRSFTYV